MHPHDPIAAALDHCLSAPTAVPPLDSVDRWWPGWAALAAQPSSPMALALLGGFAADRVGWAFAAGYQSALRALVPSLPMQALAAFCVTEEGGNRPRDIRTLITPDAGGGFEVSGAKRWTTLGPQGTLLLVTGRLAGAAPDDDRVREQLTPLHKPRRQGRDRVAAPQHLDPQLRRPRHHRTHKLGAHRAQGALGLRLASARRPQEAGQDQAPERPPALLPTVGNLDRELALADLGRRGQGDEVSSAAHGFGGAGGLLRGAPLAAGSVASSLAHESLSDTMRLNTGRCGVESWVSTQK